MSHYAIVVDLDRCIGCHGCEIACKNENEVELGSFWNKVVQVRPFGDYPHLHQYFLPVMCQQCDDSPCTHVCPTGAMHKDDNGIVSVDAHRCIGCGYCALSCPYRAPKVDRDAGRSVKCDGCTRRVAEGGAPVCVEACPLRALDFGPIDELREKYGAVADVPPLPDATATSPNLVLTPPAPAQADPDRVRAEGRVLNIREIV